MIILSDVTLFARIYTRSYSRNTNCLTLRALEAFNCKQIEGRVVEITIQETFINPSHLPHLFNQWTGKYWNSIMLTKTFKILIWNYYYLLSIEINAIKPRLHLTHNKVSISVNNRSHPITFISSNMFYTIFGTIYPGTVLWFQIRYVKTVKPFTALKWIRRIGCITYITIYCGCLM